MFKSKFLKKVLLYGFFLWLLPFMVSFPIFPLRESNRPLFESIMAVTVTLFTVLFSLLLLGKQQKVSLIVGIMLGLVWYFMSVLIDLSMFMWGPMKMTFIEYMEDIGLTYLVIPIITVGFSKLTGSRICDGE